MEDIEIDKPETGTTSEEMMSETQSAAKWPRRTVAALMLAVATVVAIVVVVVGPFRTSNSSSNTVSPYYCGQNSVTKQGRLNLTYENIPSDLLRSNRNSLQTLFIYAYNNVSGMCDGLFERVLVDATMVDWRDDETSDGYKATASWTGLVNCTGCPDSEPLFLGGSKKRPQDNRHLKSAVHIYDEVATNLFFNRFVVLMNHYLADFFNITEGGIVTLSTVDVVAGDVDQVFNVLPDSVVPTEAPSIGPVN